MAFKLKEFSLLSLLIILWGAAYGLNNLTIGHIDPILVVSGRLWIGAIFLYICAKFMKKQIPSFKDYKAWGVMASIGIIGSLLPFFLVVSAQAHIPSALASIYLAGTPLTTAILAHFFVKNEGLDLKRLFGVFLGIIGVVILFIPSLLEIGNQPLSLVWQLALIGAAFCYGAALIIVRKSGINLDPIILSFGFVFSGAIISTPFALVEIGNGLTSYNNIALFALFALGIGPTAIASILYVRMINSLGPVMVANYSNLVPFVSIFIGYAAFGEKLPYTVYIALGVILFGVFLVQKRKT